MKILIITGAFIGVLASMFCCISVPSTDNKTNLYDDDGGLDDDTSDDDNAVDDDAADDDIGPTTTTTTTNMTTTTTTTEPPTTTTTTTTSTTTTTIAATWTDVNSSLMWQVEPTSGWVNWDNAVQHCQNLTLATYSDWRLPTISELRSIIIGCDATHTGGSCGIKDGCLSQACGGASCSGCMDGGGSANGCYWPLPLRGNCAWYWSSSEVTDFTDNAWFAGFWDGSIINCDKGMIIVYARCVRGPIKTSF